MMMVTDWPLPHSGSGWHRVLLRQVANVLDGVFQRGHSEVEASLKFNERGCTFIGHNSIRAPAAQLHLNLMCSKSADTATYTNHRGGKRQVHIL